MKRITYGALLALLVPFTLRAEPVCVVRSQANLRSGPGMKYPVTWTVGENMPLMKLGQKSGWSEVQDLDGDKHWIASSAVSSRINCVVVKAKSARLRKNSESSKAADLTYVDKYTPFRKVDRDGEWVQVQDEYKGKYWVHEANIWIPMMRAKVNF